MAKEKILVVMRALVNFIQIQGNMRKKMHQAAINLILSLIHSLIRKCKLPYKWKQSCYKNDGWACSSIILFIQTTNVVCLKLYTNTLWCPIFWVSTKKPINLLAFYCIVYILYISRTDMKLHFNYIPWQQIE